MDSTSVCHSSRTSQLQTVLVLPHTCTQQEDHMKLQLHITANHICVHPPAEDCLCTLQQLRSHQEVLGQARTYQNKPILKQDMQQRKLGQV
jgi:hypothetical protein